MKVTFLNHECDVVRTHYFNKALALQLIVAETGEPMATATVNLPGETDENEIAIKDYSENEGILNVLFDAGVVGKPHRYVQSGFVQIPICYAGPNLEEIG